MQKLLAVAASMGLKVVFVKVEGGLQGCYLNERQQIVVAAGLPRALQRETLAHELGHARYGHDCSNPRNEHRAWQHALTLLFGDGAEYAELEQLGFDKFQIAEELDVTVRCVEMLQEKLHREGVSYGERHAVFDWGL